MSIVSAAAKITVLLRLLSLTGGSTGRIVVRIPIGPLIKRRVQCAIWKIGNTDTVNEILFKLVRTEHLSGTYGESSRGEHIRKAAGREVMVMFSNRILLSDRHCHKPTLTEQEIGIAMHALRVLWEAFSEETEYADKITNLGMKLNLQLQELPEEI